MREAFRCYTLATEGHLFAELFASVHFEDAGKGRQGAVLVKADEHQGTPIVRTTTRYAAPAQCFRPVHEHLARQIQEIASLPGGFNNALIENYTRAYTSMGSHSDQALDLADGSFIAVFSCYQDSASPSRKLIVESKEPGGGGFEIELTHQGVVVFSLETNRRFKHKIVLTSSRQPQENVWLGVTFRTSKTFVDAHGGLPDGRRLTLADEAQKREFFGLRGRENREMDFSYPSIPYTISESDLMRPLAE